jgi:purine-binding chemotaxis protein CheW
MASSINHQGQRTQFLSFVLGGEEYAVNILRVKEIIEYDLLTRVPSMPPCVRGVINLRGRVVPVVDLAARFGLAESTITRRSCIVMVELQDGEDSVVVGIITDAVSQVLDLADSAIEPPPSFGASINTAFILGLAELDRKFVIVLDVDRCLDVADLVGDEALVA